MLRIKDWDTHFTCNRSREVKNPLWLPWPIRTGGRAYRRLVGGPCPTHAAPAVCGCGTTAYGVFAALVGVAAKCDPPGTLSRDGGDQPLDLGDLHALTGIPVGTISAALDRLSSPEIGWILDWRAGDRSPAAPTPHPAATTCDKTAASPHPRRTPPPQHAAKLRQNCDNAAVPPHPAATTCDKTATKLRPRARARRGEEKREEKKRGPPSARTRARPSPPLWEAWFQIPKEQQPPQTPTRDEFLSIRGKVEYEQERCGWSRETALQILRESLGLHDTTGPVAVEYAEAAHRTAERITNEGPIPKSQT